MVLIRLEHHEHPAPPQHEMRQKTVLDSGDEIVGTVANLYVDEDSRQLRFVDVITDDQHYIFLGLEKKHHLVPVEAVREEDSGSITLRVDQEAVESAALPGPACRARRGVPAHHPRTLRLRLAEARTSENAQLANFAEFPFHALG
jgi:sporulation protein YlmC with PRC-barrel domain